MSTVPDEVSGASPPAEVDEAPPKRDNRRYEKPKPWDTPDIDKWKQEVRTIFISLFPLD